MKKWNWEIGMWEGGKNLGRQGEVSTYIIGKNTGKETDIQIRMVMEKYKVLD